MGIFQGPGGGPNRIGGRDAVVQTRGLEPRPFGRRVARGCRVGDPFRRGGLEEEVEERQDHGVGAKGFAAWRQGDFTTIEALLDPAVQWRWFEPGEWDCHGRQDVMDIIRERYEQGFARGSYRRRISQVAGSNPPEVASCQPTGCPRRGVQPSSGLAPRAVPERDQDSITKRLSPVTWLLKLTPRALAVTPSLVPGGVCPPGSWIWQFTSISPSL